MRIEMKAPAVLLLALAATSSAIACPAAADVRQPDLLGAWRAEVEGQPITALQLIRHPEYGGSFSGEAVRGGQRAKVAGDVDKGEFLLEESLDGVRVSGSWVGRIVEGSCGQEIRGTWQGEADEAPIVPFVLRKVTGARAR